MAEKRGGVGGAHIKEMRRGREGKLRRQGGDEMTAERQRGRGG